MFTVELSVFSSKLSELLLSEFWRSFSEWVSASVLFSLMLFISDDVFSELEFISFLFFKSAELVLSSDFSESFLLILLKRI